jgi:hypothetical protein
MVAQNNVEGTPRRLGLPEVPISIQENYLCFFLFLYRTTYQSKRCYSTCNKKLRNIYMGIM